MPFKNQHPLYYVWRSMRDRCMNPNNRQWNDYGGRGISICERWNSFQAFVDDMGPRPDGYSLDRIENDQGYSAGNCRWASRKEQQRNQRRAVYVMVEGQRYRAIELAEIAGVKTDTVIERAKRGLPYLAVISRDPLWNTEPLRLGGPANGRRQRAKTHCPHGHEYSAENCHVSAQGYRTCRTCHRERERAKRAKASGVSF